MYFSTVCKVKCISSWHDNYFVKFTCKCLICNAYKYLTAGCIWNRYTVHVIILNWMN